ncbi:putative ABC transporter, permease protein [Nocardioides flavus (ex Wang et al. 2016)]|uniref:ABC transporter, permease protein n=1 Tax=Nocardioides flavus (ex Wang et al. 2016) TaxID=2058780 RepID=A0ABQ3HIQ5_9ACTN|nr:ABC transporter permease [Nocardioides flavus (ex Wang et al. 2016)]GHE16773.1 putative ABC transporter, permease protein [Nocardioides flavus (ex Wang et al. 2016)]
MITATPSTAPRSGFGLGTAVSPIVPVGRRFLFADRRRASLTVLGVAASLMLVLILDGIFAGAVDRVTYYIRTSPADVFVSQAGVRTMHMSASTLPADTPARVEQVPGVTWAAPIAFASGSVAGPRGRQLSYLFGYDTSTGRGGPTRLVAGRAPGVGEAVLDEQAADRLGIGVGDRFMVMGMPVRAAGFSTGGSSITNTTIFVDLTEFARIHDDRVSYVLAGLDDGADPETVADAIQAEAAGVEAQTTEEFADSEARVVTDMSADLLRLMSTIGLVIALAVIALGLMTATLTRLRDFAVLKALGARTPRLAGAVAMQVLLTVVLATTVATTAVLALAWLLPLAAPAVQISITAAAVLQTATTALLVGMLAALWPLRRIASLDAATGFRETR